MTEWANRIVEHSSAAPADLIPHPMNFRRHPQAQEAALLGLVKSVGWVDDVIVNVTTGHILDGHLRVEMAIKNGEPSVPVKYVELTEEEELLVLSTFDPVTSLAELDGAALADLLGRVQMTPVEDDGVKELLAQLAAAHVPLPKREVDSAPQVDRAGELQQVWGTQLGQMWQLGEHRLIVGDCTDADVVARLMGGDVVDTVLTDPPYGIDFDTDYTKLHGGNFGTQKRNKHAPVQGDDKDFDPSHLLGFKNVVLWGANCYPQHLKAGTFLVWDKRNAAGQTLFSDAEIGWLNKGHGCYIFAHKWDGLNRESERGEHLHPTQKPVALWVWVLTEHVKDADVVFDPYCGVGGVLLACEQLGRRCRACELDAAYVAVALDRFYSATGIQPRLLEAQCVSLE